MKNFIYLWFAAFMLVSIGCLSSCQKEDDVLEAPKSELEKFKDQEHSKGNFVVTFENEDGTPIDYETATKVLWTGSSASYPYRTKVEASPSNWCNSTYYYVKFKGGDQSPTYYTGALTSSSGNYKITEEITKDYTVKTVRGFNVTVSSGTGGGLCDSGSSVSITANSAPSGKTFDKWTVSSGSGTFGSATSSSTTFKPTSTSTVLANYKSNSTPTTNYTVTFKVVRSSNPTGNGSYRIFINERELDDRPTTTHSITETVASGSTVDCGIFDGGKDTFKGWYKNGTLVGTDYPDYTTTITGNTTIEARWN